MRPRRERPGTPPCSGGPDLHSLSSGQNQRSDVGTTQRWITSSLNGGAPYRALGTSPVKVRKRESCRGGGSRRTKRICAPPHTSRTAYPAAAPLVVTARRKTRRSPNRHGANAAPRRHKRYSRGERRLRGVGRRCCALWGLDHLLHTRAHRRRQRAGAAEVADVVDRRAVCGEHALGLGGQRRRP